jgi:Putative collagen-binding domain of a collagenase
MRVRRPVSLAAGGLGAMLLALGIVLPAAGAPVVDRPAVSAPSTGGLLIVRHAGTAPVTVDTTRLTGPALRAWWVDGIGDRTVDAGAVPRDRAVKLFPPDTGDGSAHDWTLVVVDATRGLLPPS